MAAVRERTDEGDGLALAQNLGPQGMELRRPSGRDYPPATRVDLAFALPDGDELVAARGAVVFERVDGNFITTGVQFVALSEGATDRISRFVEGPAHRAAAAGRRFAQLRLHRAR